MEIGVGRAVNRTINPVLNPVFARARVYNPNRLSPAVAGAESSREFAVQICTCPGTLFRDGMCRPGDARLLQRTTPFPADAAVPTVAEEEHTMQI
jgi:hypothetical protein